MASYTVDLNLLRRGVVIWRRRPCCDVRFCRCWFFQNLLLPVTRKERLL